MRLRRYLLTGLMALTLLALVAVPVMSYEFTSNVKSFQGIKAQSSSTAVTGSAVDLTGYGEAMIVLDCGTTASTGTLDVTVTSSAATAGTYAAVSGAVFTQVTPSNDDAIYVGRLRVDPAKPFIKIVGTAATAASVYSVTVHAGEGTKARPLQTPQWTTF